MEPEEIFMLLLAVLLPPLAVFLKDGLMPSFWLCCVLCFFAWIPGCIYAAYVVVRS